MKYAKDEVHSTVWRSRRGGQGYPEYFAVDKRFSCNNSPSVYRPCNIIGPGDLVLLKSGYKQQQHIIPDSFDGTDAERKGHKLSTKERNIGGSSLQKSTFERVDG
jgi:hypothetical protein